MIAICNVYPVPTTSSSFGQGFGLIVLTSVQCSGTEARLIDCLSVQSRACHYTTLTAGVRCYAQTGMSGMRLVP